MLFLVSALRRQLTLLLLALFFAFLAIKDYNVSCAETNNQGFPDNDCDVTLDAISRHTIFPEYQPLFKNGPLENYKVQYVTHTILGSFIFRKNEFIGFTSRLKDTKNRKKNDVMVYVIQPLGKLIGKEALYAEFQDALSSIKIRFFNVTIPIFNAGLKLSQQAMNSAVYLKSVPNRAEILTYPTVKPILINGPFYVFLVDINTRKILADFYVTHISTTLQYSVIPEYGSSIAKGCGLDCSDLNFNTISYSSERIFEKAPFSRKNFVSPVGLSYILASALPFVNVSSHGGKEIVNYVAPKTGKIPYGSIHDYTKALTKNQDNFGYYFYSPTFQVPGDESNVGKFIQDANVEHTNNFTNFEKAKLGLHGLPLNSSDLMLDSDAHTLIHYFNLEGWYWSTPFDTEDVQIKGIDKRVKSMTNVVNTTFIVDEDSPYNDRYKAFKLSLQNSPPNALDPNNTYDKATNRLSVFIIFNYFSDDDRDTIPLLSDQKFTRIRLRMLHVTPEPYHVRMAMFQSRTYNQNFTSTEFPRLFSQPQNAFPSLEKEGLVEVMLEQSIHLCVTKNGLGVSDLPNSGPPNPTGENKPKQILVFSPFYFVVFDESQETVISSTLIIPKYFATDVVVC